MPRVPAPAVYNRTVNWLLVESIIRSALLEDIGHGDVSSALLPDPRRQVRGSFLAKTAGVLCGAAVAARCFTLLDEQCAVVCDCNDGAELQPGVVFGAVEGPALSVLAAERVALNFVQRLSGIATQTRRWAQRAAALGIRVVETRKTTPGLRTLEKYAVRVGGGYNHRFDLDSCVMLKDNHFAVAGGAPEELVLRARQQASHTMKVIAEARSPEMAQRLADAGADVVLLDNFSPQQVRETVGLLSGKALVEVSGGVHEANFEQYLIEGVDVISSGALTHSVKALDISLEIET
jgi:nicotinate-nucleotide pyrophosphorylase (carboxylating)